MFIQVFVRLLPCDILFIYFVNTYIIIPNINLQHHRKMFNRRDSDRRFSKKHFGFKKYTYRTSHLLSTVLREDISNSGCP